MCRSIYDKFQNLNLISLKIQSEIQQILCGSDQQKWVKRLSLQTRNFLCGVEHIVKGHFNDDGSSKGVIFQ